MTRTVAAGQTFGLHGTLSAGHTLIADSGIPAYPDGALIAVHGTASNQGTIHLLAGPGYRNLDGATGATLRVTGLLTNAALIEAAGGTDAVGRRGAVSGAAVEIAHTGSITNTGTILLDGAGTRYGFHHDGATSGALLRDNGALTNDGNLSIRGSYVGGNDSSATVVVAGVLTNAGVIEVGSGMATYSRYYGLSDAQGGLFRVLTTGTVINNGVFEVGPSSVEERYIEPPGAATLQIGGQFTNLGTLDLLNGSARYSQGSQATITGTGTLLNQGLLSVSGGGSGGSEYNFSASTPATLTNDGVLINPGTIDVNSGGNTLIDNGVLTNDGTIDVQGCFLNYYDYDKFGLLNVAGTLTNAGTLQIGAGDNDGYRYGALGAILLDTGTIDNTGTITLEGQNPYDSSASSGATLSDVGVLTNAGQIILDSFGGFEGHFGAAALLEVAGTLTNDGTIAVGVYSDFVGYGGVGTMSVSGLLENAGTVNGYGVLINTGTIASGGSGVTTGVITTTTLENSGTIEVAPSGAFLIDSNIFGVSYHAGALDIDAHATLTLGGSVASVETVDFAGIHSTLALSKLTAFYGTIAGLAPQTTIDFLHTGVTSAHAAGTTLALGLAAGGTFDLALAAPLASYATLTLAGDGNGGTDLLVARSTNADHSVPASLNPAGHLQPAGGANTLAPPHHPGDTPFDAHIT